MKYFLMLFFLLLPVCFLQSTSPSWEEYKNQTYHNLKDFQGWCTQEKAEKIMNSIADTKPKICVEIGTFGGSTSFPICRALAFRNEGMLYSIDAWDVPAEIEGMEEHSPAVAFWKKVSMEKVKESCLTTMEQHGLSSFFYPIHMRSEKAVFLFDDESIDCLYIDGNCTALGTLQDVLLYYPKVKKGGYIWLNDGNWECKIKAVSFLMNTCTWLKNTSLNTSLLVFKKEPEVSSSKIELITHSSEE